MSGDDAGRALQPESGPGPARHRDRVTMTAADQAALLAGSRKLQLATINRDGTPHLVTMFYVMLDGQIAFWTYRSAQKARNLARGQMALVSTPYLPQLRAVLTVSAAIPALAAA